MASLDATPEPLDLTFKQGATWEWTLQWLDASGSPINVIGYDFDFTMRLDYTSVDAVLTLASGSGISAAASGMVTLTAAASVTDVEATKYVYDIRGTESGKVYYVADGTLTVEPAVTR